jgi:hypothetical protein
MVAITLTGLEASAIAGVEDGLASVGDEHDRAAQDIDEFVNQSVPVALARPGTWTEFQQVDAELAEASGPPEPSPNLVLARFVEGLGIAGSGTHAEPSQSTFMFRSFASPFLASIAVRVVLPRAIASHVRAALNLDGMATPGEEAYD